jgi:transposase
MLSSIVHLAPPERRELKRRIRARAARAEDARRAEVILRLAQGQSYSSIRGALRCGQSYISRWKQRFERERLAGLYSRHRGRVPEKNSAALQARILDYTRRSPGDGSTHWTTRKLTQYNSGALCAPACELPPQPTPSSFPSPRRRRTPAPRP